MKFERTNYEGQTFGTRKIIRNNCTDMELRSYFKKMPKESDKYRMAICLNCGATMPVDVRNLIKNPPKRCAVCSGINNQSNISSKRNSWAVYEDYATLNVIFKESVVSAYIDIEDYDTVSSMTWRVAKKKNKYYLAAGSKSLGTFVYMHRLLIDGQIPPGYEIDHIDGNSLNNRRSNLRVVPRIQNIQNSKTRIDNEIGIRGITKNGGVYVVDFQHKPNRYYFKHWTNLQDAIYCRMYAEQYFDLHMLENNPIAAKYLNASAEYRVAMMEYVESVINTTKVAV